MKIIAIYFLVIALLVHSKEIYKITKEVAETAASEIHGEIATATEIDLSDFYGEWEIVEDFGYHGI